MNALPTRLEGFTKDEIIGALRSDAGLGDDRYLLYVVQRMRIDALVAEAKEALDRTREQWRGLKPDGDRIAWLESELSHEKAYQDWCAAVDLRDQWHERLRAETEQAQEGAE